MTLTELRYVVAVARERHFGQAAQACHISQPTLSVAIKKLEEELGVKLCERGVSEVSVTPLGQAIAGQAQVVLIENFTVRLLDMLGSGALVCAILAEPFPDTGLATAPLYDDPFMAPKPQRHRRANKSQVNAEELRQ